MTPAALVRRGVSQVPEGRQVFPTLPVEANLLLGAYGRVFRPEIVSSTLRYARRTRTCASGSSGIYELLPKLRELRDRPAGRTSGGEQQMVAIGRALMAEPRRSRSTSSRSGSRRSSSSSSRTSCAG